MHAELRARRLLGLGEAQVSALTESHLVKCCVIRGDEDSIVACVTMQMLLSPISLVRPKRSSGRGMQRWQGTRR